MKANEIQIGDWLYYKGQFNAFPFKVESITKKKVGYHAEPNEHRMYYLRLSECKPISLNPEILEKNGWKSKKNGSGDFILTKPMVGNSATITKTINGYEMSHGAFNGLGIHYIHQLQHALRLCGIEKEIEL